MPENLSLGLGSGKVAAAPALASAGGWGWSLALGREVAVAVAAFFLPLPDLLACLDGGAFGIKPRFPDRARLSDPGPHSRTTAQLSNRVRVTVMA